jgi:hypothetical protein
VVFAAPPEVSESTDAYLAPPTFGVVGETPSQTSDVQPQPADITFPLPAIGELRVVNNSATVLPLQDEPPTNEFGESGAHRRFGSGPMRVGDDGSRIGIGGGGGQFSTFPVKARSNTGVNAGSGLGGESFSASVADALRMDGGEGADGERAEGSENAKAWVPPPSVTIGGNAWDGDEFGNSHSRNASQDSTQLPYTQDSQPQRAGSRDALGVEKGVRFRTPSMEVSGMGPIAPGVASPMYPSAGSGWGGRSMNANAYDGEWEFEDEGTPWIRRHQE